MAEQYTPSFISTLGELHTIEYKGKGYFTLGFTQLNELGQLVRNENEGNLWCSIFEDEDEDEFHLLHVHPSFPVDPAEKDIEIAMFKGMIANYGMYVYTIEELEKGQPATLFRDLEMAYEDYPAIWYVPCGDNLLTIWNEHSLEKVSVALTNKRLQCQNAIQRGRSQFTNDVVSTGRKYDINERRLTLGEGRSFQIRPIPEYNEYVVTANEREYIFLDMLDVYIDYPAIRQGMETREEIVMRELATM